ncbi:hypothetical protein MTBLM5_90104 [Magnetospirillum sp. LM-5]|nr:hypothetical protein MTBLM5_90104 [Magnetospirillum sp. LM-5]
MQLWTGSRSMSVGLSAKDIGARILGSGSIDPRFALHVGFDRHATPDGRLRPRSGDLSAPEGRGGHEPVSSL